MVGFASGHISSSTSDLPTTITIQIQVDGGAVATSSGIAVGTAEHFWNLQVLFASIGLSASSHTYSLDVKGTPVNTVSVTTGQAGLGLVDFDSG